MILRQFLHTDPVIAAWYIVGCGGKSAAVVTDSADAPEQYVRAAADLGMRIRYVIDTHARCGTLAVVTPRERGAAGDVRSG
jgi:hydroxyacylglutathione hydrolase